MSIFLIAFFFALPLKAQVTIGDNVAPHKFSILELITKNKDGGLRLPQLTTEERDGLNFASNPDAAQGLVIYNKTTDCLEFWNGKEWISLCSDILPPPPTLEVNPESMTFDSNGNLTSSATSKVTVTTNQANWTATLTYNQDNNWLTDIPTSGRDGEQFSVAVTGSTTALRTATITVTAGGLTRYVTVAQFPDNYQDSSVSTNFRPYVGAFWKHDQTGERLIRMLRPTGSAVADGAWTAAVISGADWITLDTVMTSDPNVGWLPGADETQVDNGNDAGFDAKHAIANGSSRITGTMTATTPQIYFRIGLKSTLASDETAPRYGIVLLTYNNNNLSQRIFIRQGEAADYLFRSTDPVGNVSISGITSRTASLCRQYSPYNLTAATLDTTVAVNGASPNQGIWTAYPTQAGAIFQWATTTTNVRWAYNPFNRAAAGSWNYSTYPSTYWNDLSTSNETCPSGYRRPNDGSTSAAVDSNITLSEMRQSLYLTPLARVNHVASNDFSNSVWGYYADGFFDRRFIRTPDSPDPVTATSVSVDNNQIAHIGFLIYNPYNNASLFFPAAGFRYNITYGGLRNAGGGGYYWSSSSSSTTNSQGLVIENNVYYITAGQGSSDPLNGISVRCVKDN